MSFIKSNLSQAIVFLIRKLHAIDNLVNTTLDVNNPNSYDDLTPIDNADEDKKYSDAILWALKNKNVNNIAITGPYGSGKSSVLRTFEKDHKEYCYLNISLGTFKDELEKNSTEGKQNTLIEKSVLQQIFYRVKGKSIPYSRFNRIKNDHFFSYALRSLLLTLWLVTSFFVYKPDNAIITAISKGLSENSAFNKNTFLYASSLLFLLGLIIIIKESIRLLNHSKLNKISFTTGEVAFEETPGTSILNKHLDEILYFFEKTKFDVVIIEDLDRFDEVDIFIKLREINTLINNSEQINRKIVFIYAIKDDVFKQANRTKFFDFIVPIIPVINASNSGNILLKKLSTSSTRTSISSNFINDITLYIEDMRMLKNIHNEFVLYRDKLSSVSGIDLPLDKLLGFIVYKNKYPDDFAKLNSDEGMVAEIFNHKADLVKHLTIILESNISELEEKLSKIVEEKIDNIKELRIIYTAGLYQKIPNLTAVLLNGSKIGLPELWSDEMFKLLRTQSQILYYRGENVQYTANMAFSSIEDFVNPDISYDEREEWITKKANGRIEDLKKEVENIKEEKRDIESLSIKNLIDRFPSETIFDDVIKNQKLLVYLIRNGYIDEMYHAFISYFYEGNITKSDMAFVISVKNQEPLNFSHPLVKVKEVIGKLNRTDFKRDSVLNFDLLTAQILDPANNEYLNLILSLLSNGSAKSLEFIDSYLKKQEHANSLIKLLCNKWSGFWKCIAIDSGYTTEKICSYLQMIILHADINDVINLDDEFLLSNYISEKEDFLDFVDTNNFIKIQTIITRLKVKFVYIENPEVNKKLFDFIYEKNSYVINSKMIELIISVYNPKLLIEDDLLNKSNFTTILNSNCTKLIEYIEANINEYVQNVLLRIKDNIQESEKTLIILLNNEDIENENKSAIIEKEAILLDDITTINDIALWDELVLHSKIMPTWNNVLEYFKKEENLLDELIISFLNRSDNYKTLSESIPQASEKFPDDLIRTLFKQLMVCEELSDESYPYLLKSIPYAYGKQIGFENFSDSKVNSMINEGNLGLTADNYAFLKEHFSYQHALLAEKFITAFIKAIDDYELDAVGMSFLLKSGNITADQKITIVNNVDVSIVNNDISRAIYDISSNHKASLKLALPILEILLQKNDLILIEKVNLFLNQSNGLEISVISRLLKLFPSQVSGLFTNQQPILDNNDTFKRFANKLLEKGFISSFKEKGKTLRLYPKKSNTNM